MSKRLITPLMIPDKMRIISKILDTIIMARGVGTGETGEARASPEIRGCLKSNRQEKKYVGYSFF